MPKKTTDGAAAPFEIGSPLETADPIEAPSPPRSTLRDRDNAKTPLVETVERPDKRAAELQALLDDATAELAHLRLAVEAAAGALTDIAAALEHEGDELDDGTCSDAPDDCVRCLAEAAAKAANGALLKAA